MIPGIAKWGTAGGGAGENRRYSYTFYNGNGEYHIWPVQTRTGRPNGYTLKYAASRGKTPRTRHSGLWHELGSFRSPAAAAKAARLFDTAEF